MKFKKITIEYCEANEKWDSYVDGEWWGKWYSAETALNGVLSKIIKMAYDKQGDRYAEERPRKKKDNERVDAIEDDTKKMRMPWWYIIDCFSWKNQGKRKVERMKKISIWDRIRRVRKK